MSRSAFPVAVHLFLKAGSKILLQRRYNTGYEDGNFSVIAGHIDGGEDVYTAMVREAREEAGIDISPGNLKIVHVMHRKTESRESIDYFFECFTWEGSPEINELNKCDKLEWFDICELPDNVVSYVQEAIKNYGEHIPFSIYGW